MKWIGQHIWDFISRFRDDVYLENISSGTITSGGNLGLDSNNKIVKASDVGSSVDLTSEITGTLPIANGGTGNTTGVQSGKSYRIYNTSFRQDIGTTKYYIPLKSQDEQTVLTREEISELSVCDGRVVSVSLRTEVLNTHSGDATVTFGVETNTLGTGYSTFSGTSETESLTINDADDHHFFHYVFDAAKHWDSTDMWAISIQSDTDISGNNERFFVTVVVEDNWSTYIGGASREIETTPV